MSSPRVVELVFLLAILVVVILTTLESSCAVAVTLSAKLIHRFSDELKPKPLKEYSNNAFWPHEKKKKKSSTTSRSRSRSRSLEYYKALANSDFNRQKMRAGPQYQLLFPFEGSQTMSFGNDFGWLHYIWIDIGTPNTPFLVALDVGSDLLWLPCECIQCAPLSGNYYQNLDRDLNEYNPSSSTTSKTLPCSHQLCDSTSSCKSPNEPCPYTVNYYSENTSTSGLLIEDILHLSSGSNEVANTSVRASVVIGCGMRQSGSYMKGVAPDGLMGLGLGEISVPSYLSKSGLVRNSFSLCFDEDDSGRIFFGDQGPRTQQSTSFLPSEGKYITYIVEVNAFCIQNSCVQQTNFRAVVDSGSSFTYLPNEVYKMITESFDRHVKAARSSFKDSPWEYCYKPSSNKLPEIPSVTFIFQQNDSFMVQKPIFVINGEEGIAGFCLAIQRSDEDIGVIGQNFMIGYRLVFDRENLKLGWSKSKCEDFSVGKPSLKGAPPNPLPANEQEHAPTGRAVAPAIAGRTPGKPSAASHHVLPSHFWLRWLLLLLLLDLIHSVDIDTI